MKKFDHIYWDQKYTVHDEALDQQHRELFEIANRLIDKYESGSTQTYDTIEELVDYLWGHFRVEQRLMMELNYPDFTSHIAQHKKFMDKVENFLQECRAGKEDLTPEILSFLVNWVFSHTTSLDLKYGEYLVKSQYKK